MCAISRGQFIGQTKILLTTRMRQMVTIVNWSHSTQKRAHCLDTSCLTDGLDVAVKREVCVPQPETLLLDCPDQQYACVKEKVVTYLRWSQVFRKP